MKSRGFSLIELIIVITIISILATVSFVGYTEFVVTARDGTRRSDMGLVKSALRSHKQKTGAYPLPITPVNINNQGANIAKQGLLDKSVSIRDLPSIPVDPRTGRSYGFSTLTNKQYYQLGMTLENEITPRALIDGDFKTPAKYLMPSLLLALTWGITTADVATITYSPRFVVNNGEYNLVYWPDGVPVVNTTLSLTAIVSASGVVIPEDTSFLSCAEIKNAGLYLWIGVYTVAGTVLECRN